MSYVAVWDGSALRRAGTRDPLGFELNFAGLTTPPPTVPTGQPLAFFNAAPVIINGHLDSSTDSATYMEVGTGWTRIDTLGARWRFDTLGGTVGGGGSGTMTLITWADGGIVANGFGRRTSAHVTITAANVQWWVRDVAGGGNVTPLTGRSTGGLASNTLHTVEVDVKPGVGRVTLNGVEYEWTDPRIVQYPGESWACWEPYYGGANRTRVRIAEIWAAGS